MIQGRLGVRFRLSTPDILQALFTLGLHMRQQPIQDVADIVHPTALRLVGGVDFFSYTPNALRPISNRYPGGL